MMEVGKQKENPRENCSVMPEEKLPLLILQFISRLQPGVFQECGSFSPSFWYDFEKQISQNKNQIDRIRRW